MDAQSIYLGILTKNMLKKFLDQGDISQKQYKEFHDAAHYYFKSTLEYIGKKFPLDDPLIFNAVWVNVLDRANTKWEHVQYFYDLFPNLMSDISADDLYEEFTDYQTLCDDDFEDVAWEKAKVLEGLKHDDGENLFHYRMDVLWYYIANMKIAGSNAKRFKLLPKVAEFVLIIPHNNSELEILVSIVKKNIYLQRSSMKLDGTLSSILAMKTMYPESSTPCYHWKPTEDILKT